jgi:thiamine biosynthesis lipoprotein ApbE
VSSRSIGDLRDAERPAWEFAATGKRARLHDGALSSSVVDVVVQSIAADEERWSRFREDGEVSAIKRSAGRWTEVSLESWELLEACVKWVEHSAGVFTPLIGAALRPCGYEQSVARQPAGCDRSPQPVRVTGTVELDRTRRRVRIPSAASLDLGGIGKRWIADRPPPPSRHRSRAST